MRPRALLPLLLVSAAAILPGPARVSVCDGFLPPNDLKVPIGALETSGIDKAAFDAILDRFEAVYKPIIAAKGGKLQINRKWTDETVNASAEQIGGVWHVNMYGGLARHPSVTPDGFAVVVCHELGHHLGGFPKIHGWATNEGGADYYSTLKCLRMMNGELAAPAVVAQPLATSECAKHFAADGERHQCERGAMAGYSLASLFQALHHSAKPLDFGVKDPAVVRKMDDAHPAPQCRLDTYFRGALCDKPVSEELSNTDESVGACGYTEQLWQAARPLCWYKEPGNPMIEPWFRKPAPPKAPLPAAASIRERLENLGRALSGRGV